MEISDKKTTDTQRPFAPAVPKTGGSAAPDKTAAAQKPGPADTVNISQGGKVAADLIAAVNNLPEDRNAKVQEIRQAVTTGTYTVDPRKVAESILKDI